jgi:hypothetical protein
MEDESMLSEGDVFNQNSTNFLDWFAAAKGSRLSHKFELQDLHHQQAGRGAGIPSYSPFCALPTKQCC